MTLPNLAGIPTAGDDAGALGADRQFLTEVPLAAAASYDTRRACAGRSTSFFSICITAQTHLVVLMGFRVLPIIPVVQPKTALPRFGHAQIVLTGVRKGEVPSTAFDSLYRLSSNRNGLTLTLRLGQI